MLDSFTTSTEPGGGDLSLRYVKLITARRVASDPMAFEDFPLQFLTPHANNSVGVAWGFRPSAAAIILGLRNGNRTSQNFGRDESDCGDQKVADRGCTNER